MGVASGFAFWSGRREGICGFGSENDQLDGSSGSPEVGGWTDSVCVFRKLRQRETASRDACEAAVKDFRGVAALEFEVQRLGARKPLKILVPGALAAAAPEDAPLLVGAALRLKDTGLGELPLGAASVACVALRLWDADPEAVRSTTDLLAFVSCRSSGEPVGGGAEMML